MGLMGSAEIMSMRILERQIGEVLIIDGNIEITVRGVKGDQVRILTRAPREVRILREEVADRSKELV